MPVYKSKKETKDGRKYFFRVRYKDLLGEKHDYTSPKFKKKKEAEEEEIRYRAKIGELVNNSSDLTIKNLFEELMEEKKTQIKRQTIGKYYDLFLHFKAIENYKIKELDISKIKKFRNEIINEKLSVKYTNKILGLLKQIIIYSSKTYNTSDGILKHIENVKNTTYQKKEMLFFTYDEYKQFDNVIKDNEWHTFFEVLYFMGLRQGECQALTWNDIDFNKKELLINKTLTTKNKNEKWSISTPKTKTSIRTLPIPKKLLNDLKTLKNEAMKYSDYNSNWFVFGNVIPFKETTIQQRKNKYCKIANVKQIRIHDFRHSCASLLINKGASIVLVSKYLGHSDIKTTLNTYSHMYKSELEAISDTLNKLE